MKNWIRVDTDFVDHPKVERLASVVGSQEAGWHVIRLWSWMSRFCPEGHFGDIYRDVAETKMGWRGEAGALLAAMIEVGLVDYDEEAGIYQVHDWDEFQGKVAEQRRKEREKKARQRAEIKRKQSMALSPGTSPGHPALRYVTERDVTERTKTTPPTSPSLNQLESLERKQKRGVTELSSGSKTDVSKRPVSGEESLETLQAAATGSFQLWSSRQLPAIGMMGENATAATLRLFRKHSHDRASVDRLSLHFRVAFTDFAGWCQREGLKPGWGLWLSDEVGEYRLNQARAGELPRPQGTAAARPGAQPAASNGAPS